MNRYSSALNSMKSGKCMLIDGATATEMERRGVPQLKNAWNGGGALSHPEVLKKIHSEYIQLGAKLVISNTFATCKHTLVDANQSQNFEILNSDGVRLAIEARSELEADNVLVAGGISYWSFTGRDPSLSTLEKDIIEQAHIMEEAGADLIVLEMMKDIDRLIVSMDAAGKTKLPIWVGLSCDVNSNGQIQLLGGETLQEAISEIKTRDIDLISIMHTEVHLVEDCLTILRDHWSGLCGVYAHSGTMKNSNWAMDMENTDWTFDQVISPTEYTNYVEKWIGSGVNLVGGCCGISTDHMRHISENISF